MIFARNCFSEKGFLYSNTFRYMEKTCHVELVYSPRQKLLILNNASENTNLSVYIRRT